MSINNITNNFFTKLVKENKKFFSNSYIEVNLNNATSNIDRSVSPIINQLHNKEKKLISRNPSNQIFTQIDTQIENPRIINSVKKIFMPNIIIYNPKFFSKLY